MLKSLHKEQIVMQDFSLFDTLPSGIIVFREGKLVYISQHILDVLNLTYLSRRNALEILVQTLQLEKEDQLFDFFISHDYFLDDDKVIQINHNRDDVYDYFVFTLIFEPIVSHNIMVEKVEEPRTYIDEKVAKFFKINKLKRVKALTFYKGIPLKNFADIMRVSDQAIELKVDKKHLISLKEKNEITLIYNEKSPSVILGEIVDTRETRFTIKNFYLAKEGMHQREGVRVKTNGALFIQKDEQRFEVYDISKKGISIFISTEEEESFLKAQRSATLIIANTNWEISLSYLKTVYEHDKILKIIFEMQTSKESKNRIDDYITNKQNEILREIHQFLY